MLQTMSHTPRAGIVRLMGSLVLAALTLGACTSMDHGKQVADGLCQGKGGSCREKTVTFEAGKVIELAYATVKPGKEKQVFGEYFPKAGPIVKEYGGKSLAIMNITDVPAGDINAQIVGFFEWPSVEAFLAFHEDPRYQAIKPLRDDGLSYLNNGNFFTVAEDTTYTFHEDRDYEVWAAWIKPDGGSKVGEYLKQIKPALHEYGHRNVVSLQPVSLTSAVKAQVVAACNKDDHDFEPHAVGLAEWPSIGAFNDFLRTDVYKNAKHLKDEALDRFNMQFTRFSFPPV